jgi:hypothetical protein
LGNSAGVVQPLAAIKPAPEQEKRALKDTTKGISTMKTFINVVSFVIMAAFGRLWIEYDQYFLSKQLLMPVFLVILVALMSAYFYIVKPKDVRRFALYLSFTVCILTVALSLLQHVVLQHNFNLYWKHSLTIWVFALIVPNIIGFGYSQLNRNAKGSSNAISSN